MKEVTPEEKREIDVANWATVYPESIEDLKRRIENLDSMNHNTLFDTFVDIPEGSFAIAFPEKWFNKNFLDEIPEENKEHDKIIGSRGCNEL